MGWVEAVVGVGRERGWLEGGLAVFSGADSDDVFDAGDDDLAVADAAVAGASGGFDDGVDGGVFEVVGDDGDDEGLGTGGADHLRSPAGEDLDTPLLPLSGYVQVVESAASGLFQGVGYGVDALRSDDCFYL